LRGRLRDELEKDGWQVSERPERDEQGRESDIVIRRDGREAHVEVKHVQAGYFYWSEREVSKAKDCATQGNYWLALITGGGDQHAYDLQWLFSPLQELEPSWHDGRIQVEYTWKATKPVNREQPWDIGAVPLPSAPSNFSFKIPHGAGIGVSRQDSWIRAVKDRLQAPKMSESQ
jgi:hypothetical protein